MRRILAILLLPLILHGASHGQSAQQGTASFYADKFHGRTTAMGERYDMNKHTAAHMALPFGTVVRVTNLENGKATVVRINDRGPFSPNRVIDLSKVAAQELDMLQKGTARVKIEIVDKSELRDHTPSAASNPASPSNAPGAGDNSDRYRADPPGTTTPPPARRAADPETTSTLNPYETGGSTITEGEFYSVVVGRPIPNGYAVQIASFQELGNLLKQAAGLDQSLSKLVKVHVVGKDGLQQYKLLIGTFPSRSEAETYRERLRLDYPGAFVVAF